MSSILKALKKAEQDSSRSVRLPGQTKTPQRFFISKKTDHSQKKFWKSKNIWFSFGAVFVIGLSFFIFLKNNTPPIPQEKMIQEPLVFESPKVTARSEVKQKKENIYSPSLDSQTASTPAFKTESLLAANSPLPPNPAQENEPGLPDTLPPPEREISLPVNAADTQVALKDQISVKEPDTRAASLPLEPIKEYIEEEIPDDISIDDDITELIDENIKIQAISWSQTPEDRIAVINNKIISEMDYIQEYSVIQIRKDEIILLRSGKRYLLKFKYH